MCYRLLWNLKNAGKIKEFDEVTKMTFCSLNSKLYGLINTTNGPHVFDLSTVYTAIPTTLNTKEFDVSPEGHEIEVVVNQGMDEVRKFLSNPNKAVRDDANNKNKPVGDKDKDEVTAEVIEEEVINNEDIEPEEKHELIAKFSDNILDKMKDQGLDMDEILEK